MVKKKGVKMSDLSIFASKFQLNSESLKEFDESLRFLKGKNEIIRTPEVENVISKLLIIINSISESISGEFSEATVISERDIIDILREWHNADWPTYKENILKLNSKLKANKFQLSKDDFKLLDDIGDALDAECQNLFRRMRER